MPRKTRIEIEGGLYHVITRGNDRKNIFHAREDHDKFLQLLNTQKNKLPFYLYAYCLMTNHLHLLIERRDEQCSRRIVNKNRRLGAAYFLDPASVAVVCAVTRPKMSNPVYSGVDTAFSLCVCFRLSAPALRHLRHLRRRKPWRKAFAMARSSRRRSTVSIYR